MKRNLKNRSILLILLLSLISNISFAQIDKGSQLKWSEPMKVISIENIGFNNDYFVIRELKPSPLYPGVFNSFIIVMDRKSFKEVNTSDAIKSKYKSKKYSYAYSKVAGNKLYIVSATNNYKYKIIQVYSLPSLKLEKTIDVGHTKSGINYQLNGDFFAHQIKNNKPTIQMVVSDNNKELAIIFDNSGGVEGDDKMQLIVYNTSENNELTKNVVELNISGSKFRQLNILETNSGKPFILYTINDSKEKSIRLLNLSNGASFKLEKEIIPLNAKMISKDDNNILISGMAYFEDDFNFFFSFFDIDSEEFESFSSANIDISNTLKYYTISQQKSFTSDLNKLPLLRYSIDDVKELSNGGYVLYGEYYSVSGTSSSNGFTLNHTANEIWVAYFDKEMEVTTFKVIPKWQIFANRVPHVPAWGSYFPILKDDKMYFIYEENSKNLNASNLANTHKVAKNKADITAITSIDENGDIKTSKWIDNKDAKIYPSPFISADMGGGKYLIGSNLNKKFRFAILEY